MLPDDLAERLAAIADDILRIRPLSHTRPHLFLEDKDEAAAKLRAIVRELKSRPALQVRDSATPPRFQAGVVRSSRGVAAVVQFRGRRKSAA